MIDITVSVPYWVVLPRKRKKDLKVYLNFNQYHNWCKHIRNNIKQKYTESISGIVKLLPEFECICNIDYTLYTGTNRLCDTNNYIVLVDKYFCDALVINNIIPDDNYTYIKYISSTWGGIDKSNPRVDIRIQGY